MTGLFGLTLGECNGSTSNGNSVSEMALCLILIFIVFNATFSNISAISWRPVLVVEEAGVPGKNHRSWEATGKLYHVHPFLITRIKTILC